MTTRLTLLLLMAAALCPFAAAPAQAQDDEPLQPAPAAAIKEFIAKVKASNEFAVANALAPGNLASELATLSAQCGYSIEAETRTTGTFIFDILLENGPTFGTENDSWTLSSDDGEYTIELRLTHSRLDAEGQAFEETWLVTPEQLAEINIRFVQSVAVIHPLVKPLARCTAEGESLTKLAARLAALGRVEFTINASKGNDVALTFDLTNRTLAECFTLAAYAAGWTVQFIDANGQNVEPRNSVIGHSDVYETWRARQRHNTRNPDRPIQSPLDALRHLVESSVTEMKANRLVVVLQP